jgi:hypothetical protein
MKKGASGARQFAPASRSLESFDEELRFLALVFLVF